MALKVEYKDEHGVVQINMSPTPSCKEPDKDICDVPKFDTINNRFAQYDLFGGKYDVDSGGETPRSLFRSRYNSIEEELANTPYAFTTERSLRLNSANKLDIRIQSRLDDISPSKDIEDDRFFKRKLSLDYNESIFGPQIDFKVTDTDTPAFTVTQLIHAQDRYFDLSGRQSESPCSAKVCSEVHVPSPRGDDEAFRVLGNVNKEAAKPVVPTPKRKKESSFAILAETPVSRPTSPRSLPVDIRTRRISPFRGRGFREETSRHNTPWGSACNSRANSPPRRRTNSLSRLDMASSATLPLPIHTILSPHSPRNFLKENIDDVRELSELNREKHEAEAKRKRIEEEEALLKEMGLLNKSGSRSVVGSRTNSRSNSPNKISFGSRSNSPSGMLRYENFRASREYINGDDGMRHQPVAHRSRVRTTSKSQPQSHDGSPKHSKIPTRQNSVSPTGGANQKLVENGLNKKQRYISNSTSSIHDTGRVGNRVHDKRSSKSTQQLSISPTVKGKPPISPGRGGPPPSNKALNPKRLSPIVGTPSKSPADDVKSSSARVPLRSDTTLRMAAKTVGHTLAASRLNSRQPSRAASRDTSPEKLNQPGTRPGIKKMVNRTMTIKNLSRTPSTNSINETSSSTKPGLKKMVNRTMTIKNLSGTPGSKNVNEISSLTKPGLKKMVNRTITIKNLQRTPSSSDVNETSPSRKPGMKKMVNRTITIKNLSRTPSATDVNETSPLKSAGSKKNLANLSQTLNKITDLSKKNDKSQGKVANKNTSTEAMSSDCDGIEKQDNETQYDKIPNDKNELVIMTKKNIISMTTAAITSQPLEVVTKVTNQLPAAFEKAREKGIFERLNSKDSLGAENCGSEKQEHKKANEEDKPDDKKPLKNPKITLDKITLDKVVHEKVIPEIKPAIDDHIKLRPLQPPYNNPQVERVKQKIEAILKEPEVSAENILTASAKSRDVKKLLIRSLIQKAKEDDETSLNSKEPEVCITETKVDVEPKVKETKVDIKKTNDEECNKPTEVKDEPAKKTEIKTEEIRTEITKIVDSIITPVEQPKEEPPKAKVPEKLMEIKKDIEPVVTVVSEKRKHCGSEIAEKETLVKGEGEVEVQSSNVSTPGLAKFVMQKKAADGNASELSSQSNGGFPQSTSTTPKPPVRTKKETKDKSPIPEPRAPPPPVHCGDRDSIAERPKDPNFCQRLINKCKSKCCTCCTKGDNDDEKAIADGKQKKGGVMSKLNCCKKNKEMAEEDVREIERAAGKASIEYETETKRTRKLRDVLCGCCGRSRRVADTGMVPRNVADSMSPAPEETGCCGRKKRIERRDSILSDRPPASCCGRACAWFRGTCRRGHDASRRASMFSKNKSMSPTLPPEDTRKKLDTSLVEHTSVMRGAIPVLPIVLAYFCLLCNIVIPGLGTIFSGMFCLCFGIPRFGVHDGAKHRLGSFVINLLVGVGQLFTVLFCLVGWGWSIWWGVIMLNISRKYRKLKREAEAEEAEAAPPVTTNNHTRA